MTPQQFIAKWQGCQLAERAFYQQHFNDLCALAGHPTPAAQDTTGDTFCFEKGATKTGGGNGWADVWKRGFFAVEYKGPGGDLRKALDQVQRYALALENPPLLVVARADLIEIHTNFTNTVSDTHIIALEEIGTPENLAKLRVLFFEPERLRPVRTTRAQGAVYYRDPATKAEYALVADYHMIFNNPGYIDGSMVGKQAGGKVGIIKDPFGTAEYLGSTTPIIDASIKDLSISPNGNSLLGNINYWGGLPSGILSWNLSDLIKAAKEHSLKQQSSIRPMPFDRTGTVSSNTQIPAATPQKLDFGWVFGMNSNVTTPVIEAGSSHFGDIARVDIVKAIEAIYPNVCPLITGFNEANISIESGSAKLVTYVGADSKTTHYVSGAQDSKLNAVSAASAASYTGEFGKDGVFFLSAQFTQAEMDKLRKGEHLDNRTVEIRISGLTVGDKSDQSYVIKINLNDFSDTAGRVFFGDRPLGDPGYSKFELSGAVSKSNTVDTAAEALDVWRVEQRLKYLGFPVFNKPNSVSAYNQPASNNPRHLVEFNVDGKFGAEEVSALRAFYADTHMNVTPIVSDASNSQINWGQEDVPASANAVAAGSDTLAWLNAYNAPHWMNIYASLGIPNNGVSVNGLYQDNQDTQENYGTSWERDLLKAREVTLDKTAAINTLKYWINGFTDPGYSFDTHSERNHSIGMGIDLGLGQWIIRNNQIAATSENNPNIDSALASVLGSGWSVDRALQLSGKLPGVDPDSASRNNQEQALRDFLALYALTRNDGDASNNNGTWEELLPDNETVRKALFGDGTKDGGLIAALLVGDTAYNPYTNIHKVLDGLDILNTTSSLHQNHFHITLRTPNLQAIVPSPQNLLADDAVNQTGMNGLIQGAAQTLIAEMQNDLNLQQGEINMFIMDMPDVPPQFAPVVIAQAEHSQPEMVASGAVSERTIGVCQLIMGTDKPDSAFNAFSPATATWIYLQRVAKQTTQLTDEMLTSAKVTLLQGAKHGTVKEEWGQNYRYLPSSEYTGADQATFLVEMGNYKFKLVYHFKVGGEFGANDAYDSYKDKKNCPNGEYWKISTTQDANGSLVVNSVEYQSPVVDASTNIADTLSMGSLLNNSIQSSFNVDASSITVNFADLPGGAVGQTTGTNITLDTAAAGYNWFIDTTPGSNEEFLPPSNPYEWVAKAGSAAEGKMDMLSVLLHEYGHALGIDHSADGHDYMATTLTPGVRRMPNAEELALMQQLIGAAKDEMISTASTPTPTLPLQGGGGQDVPLPIPLGAGFGIAFLGRMRNSRYGGMSIDTVGAQFIAPVPQYEAAANATFTNLNTPAGWNTQGGVDIANGAATLNEVSTSQTRLSQVFMLNARDRYLSFKLSGLPLPNPLPQAGEGANVAQSASQTPQDAFEVALLDANTGASLLGNDGLTRTDAIINLQGDGTQRTASCVTCINNSDGSRTYRVDLTGIAAGTVANLSFDLLGFGAANRNGVRRDSDLCELSPYVTLKCLLTPHRPTRKTSGAMRFALRLRSGQAYWHPTLLHLTRARSRIPSPAEETTSRVNWVKE